MHYSWKIHYLLATFRQISWIYRYYWHADDNERLQMAKTDNDFSYTTATWPTWEICACNSVLAAAAAATTTTTTTTTTTNKCHGYSPSGVVSFWLLRTGDHEQKGFSKRRKHATLNPFCWKTRGPHTWLLEVQRTAYLTNTLHRCRYKEVAVS
jgi:hypothetical protein